MQTENGSDDLTGQVLVAMPGMGDPRFEKSVVFLCAHSDEGAMGLIVNKPAQDLPFAELLEQMGIATTDAMRPIKVHFGGPVEHGRGFVLHSRDYVSNSSTLEISDTIGMTATLDILEDIAQGSGPRDCLLALGYAGWGPGQLEGELQQNGWLTVQVPDALLFDPDTGAKWEQSLKVLGINPLLLSSVGGNA